MSMVNDLEILEDIIDYKKTVDKLSDISSNLSTEEKLLAFTNLTSLKQDILTKITLLEKERSDNEINLSEDKSAVVEEPVTIKEEKTSFLDRLLRRK